MNTATLIVEVRERFIIDFFLYLPVNVYILQLHQLIVSTQMFIYSYM